MKLYIVIVNDRHIDVDAYPFSDKETAFREARRIAKENCNYPECYEEALIDNRLFITYSSEDDYVSVVCKDLDSTIDI